MKESQGKNGSAKPPRWKPCLEHLEAGLCGVDKPHGHCPCKSKAHFHALLNLHIAELQAEQREATRARDPALEIMDMLDLQIHDEREAELTAAFNSFDFVIEEAQQQNACTHTPPAQASGTHEPSRDNPPASSDFNAPQECVPSTDEIKESLTDDSSDDDVSDTESDVSDSDLSWLMMDTCVERRTSPKVRRMTVFVNATVGDENLSIPARIGNWLMQHLPFTTIDDSTTVNAASPGIFSETIDLRSTNTREVKAFWQSSGQPGAMLAQASGTFALFRDLLPACMEVEVYESLLLSAACDPRLNKLYVITRDNQISQALGPYVREYVYSQAAKMDGCYDNPALLTWTIVAIMNQLTATAIVTKMASTGAGLDFRTRGQSHTMRL